MAEDRASPALAEGLYWYAEKLMWGYEGVDKNPEEAFKLYRQSADLGFSDALIRVGYLQENGIGTEQNPRGALESYAAAVRLGNFFALAFLAKLLTRSAKLEQAELIWRRFFAALDRNSEADFLAATRGELLHDYIVTQLRVGFEPGYSDRLRAHRLEIIGHHQQLLEHASDDRLDRLDGTSEWIATNL